VLLSVIILKSADYYLTSIYSSVLSFIRTLYSSFTSTTTATTIDVTMLSYFIAFSGIFDYPQVLLW
jgi:hypothetical protein